MKKLILITFFGLFGYVLNAQTSNDTISMVKVFGGYKCHQNGKLLKMNQIVAASRTNPEAYKVIKSAQSNYTLATILGAAGGFMVGWPIGTMLGGGEPNWGMAGVGAGLIAVSIPVSIKSNKQLKSGIDLYNKGIKGDQAYNSTKLYFTLNSSGVGLVWKL